MSTTVVESTSTSSRRWAKFRARWRGPGLIFVYTLGGLAIGGLIIALTGHNPIDAYRALVDGALFGPGFTNLQATAERGIPIVGMGLATAIAFRAGFFNLGGEGQIVLGGFAAALTALYLPIPSPFLMPTALASGALAGGLYASFAALLQFRLAVPLLVSTLILNYPARYFVIYMVDHHFRDIMSGMPETHLVPDASRLPMLPVGNQVQAGVLIIVALIVVLAFVMRRSTLGYEMTLTGLNPNFARYGGVSVERIGYLAMAGSGGVAGLVGGIVVLGDFGRYINGALTDPLYAWTGLMAALLAGSSPVGVAIIALFFSGLETGALGMEQATSVPRELAQVLQATIILLIVSRTKFRSTAGKSAQTGSS